MAYSAHYRTLENRFIELRKRFLPKQFSKTGTYTNDQLDKARAFRVLTHAELEHYFEERALEIANIAFDLWKTKSKASSSLTALLANVVGDQQGLPKKLGTKVTASSIAGKIVAQYKHCIMTNNGIRTTNILQILLPIGIVEADIDIAWLSTIDGFGAKRGATAHTSAVSHLIDPKDDFQTVTLIMQGIKDIDLLLNSIKKGLR